MSRPSLTERQSEVLRLIRKGVAGDGVRPTYSEIADAIGVSSPATVWEHVDALEEKGYLERRAAGRTIKLLDRRCPHCGKRLEADQ